MSAIVHIDCEQGQPEWYAARLAMPTASMYGTVLAKGKSGGESLTRKTYLYKLAGEMISGDPMVNYVSAAMERGKVMEEEARELYAFLHDDAELKQVGFIRNGDTGCSPDRLIGDDGILEIKTNEPHILIDLILKDKFPPEHIPQCQGSLMVTGRQWIDIACYWPKMPLFVKRAYRDEAYIKALSEAIDAFNVELAEIVAKIRGYGHPPRRRHWSELSLPEQAGIKCSDESFRLFLNHKTTWVCPTVDDAADIVRQLCGVKSRAELGTDDAAAERWVSLDREYENWKHGT